jgi:hypothetical protein
MPRQTKRIQHQVKTAEMPPKGAKEEGLDDLLEEPEWVDLNEVQDWEFEP